MTGEEFRRRLGGSIRTRLFGTLAGCLPGVELIESLTLPLYELADDPVLLFNELFESIEHRLDCVVSPGVHCLENSSGRWNCAGPRLRWQFTLLQETCQRICSVTCYIRAQSGTFNLWLRDIQGGLFSRTTG